MGFTFCQAAEDSRMKIIKPEVQRGKEGWTTLLFASDFFPFKNLSGLKIRNQMLRRLRIDKKKLGFLEVVWPFIISFCYEHAFPASGSLSSRYIF
jgi:hypothetical protein